MKKTLIAAALLAAGLAGTAQAALVTLPFQYRVDFADPAVAAQLGLPAGSGFGGTATYDDSIAPVDGLYAATAFNLDFGNLSFTGLDDVSGLGVGVGVEGGSLSSLYFTTLFTLVGGSGNGEYLLDLFGTQAVLTPSGDSVDYKLTASAVPVPPALPLLAAGLGVMGWLARRGRAGRHGG